MSYWDDWKVEIQGHAELRSLHEVLRAEVQRRWQRSLPFADELFDRSERASFLGFGEGSSVYDSCLVIGDVEVGAETWIGPFTVLDGSGGLRIGSSCSISAGVQIYTHDTVRRALTGGSADIERAEVTIGDNTYLGPNALVTKGVAIGTHCVIGAQSLVNRDIPSNSIVFGVPGRVVGRTVIGDRTARLVFDE